jgi:hypothetical protein
MADRTIISGDAGTTWTNDTERVRYQFIAALINTCGTCLQYHLKISSSWPIPIHYNCRCIQRLIKPGQTAPLPFVDYRELLDGFDQSQKSAAIGASNYKLLKSGLATWEDIVTPNRVCDFREVVSKKRLSIETMTMYGVSKYQATTAFIPRNTSTSSGNAASCFSSSPAPVSPRISSSRNCRSGSRVASRSPSARPVPRSVDRRTGRRRRGQAGNCQRWGRPRLAIWLD